VGMRRDLLCLESLVKTYLLGLLMCRYGDLLALVEDFDEMRASTRVLRQVPSRRASQAATKPGSGKLNKKPDEDSSSESSDVSQLAVAY